jgi:hypothetical protein
MAGVDGEDVRLPFSLQGAPLISKGSSDLSASGLPPVKPRESESMDADSDGDEPVVFSLETLKDHVQSGDGSQNSQRLTRIRKSLSESLSKISSVQKVKRSFMLNQHKAHTKEVKQRRKSQIIREAQEMGFGDVLWHNIDHASRRSTVHDMVTYSYSSLVFSLICIFLTTPPPGKYIQF